MTAPAELDPRDQDDQQFVAFVLRARAFVCNALVLGGLAAIGYGVVYFWKGLAYRLLVLIVCVGLGCLPLGAGLSLRRRPGVPTLVVATVCFALSGALQLLLLGGGAFVHPLWITLQVISWGGAARSFVRARAARRNNRSSGMRSF
ncbi:MAG TPA: hypothetical protein VIF57_15220 [Polyangia bacterium]